MKKLLYLILPLLLVIAAYWFWAVPYRSLLSYQEQFQLFQLGGSYLSAHLGWPGGFATYIAEFFVQFFNNYWVGALIVALVLLAVQQFTWLFVRCCARENSVFAYILTFVPAIATWMFMADINHMPSFAVSLICVLAAAVCYARFSKAALRILFILVALPLVYWLAGTSVYLLAALICVKEATYRSDKQSCLHSPAAATTLSAGAVIYTLALVWLSTLWVPYPASQIWIGINYYRQLVTMPPMIPVIWGLVILTAACGVALCRCTSAPILRSPIIAATLAVIIVACGALAVSKSLEPRVCDLAEYDYLLRIGAWDAIIAKAEKRTPDTQLAVCATNLALGMKRQLDTRAFEFYQNGVEGLFPTFEMDGNTALVLSEVYFQLGLVNTAQRLTFEAMESNPNFKKSVRAIKRLVETNMIRGNYAVAEKYLKMLDKTVVYSKWADRTRRLIAEPGAIDSHPLYGRLRLWQIDDDFLFSDIELDKIMGRLVMANPDNALARQYLLMYPLLQRDLPKFMQYMQAVDNSGRPPKIVQQALLMAYVNSGKSVPPGLTDPLIAQQFQEFAQVMVTQGKDSGALERFRDTLWYYLVKAQ